VKIERLPHDPATLAEFFEGALGSLGALCDREWHDQLTVMAEGRAARLWRDDGALHEARLRFLPADATHTAVPADPHNEVFPGCPLTFRLAEALRPNPLTLERAIIAHDSRTPIPEAAMLEKLWFAQHPRTRRWRMLTPLKPAFHFSLVALVRCEMQAIDQRWSLHRLALSLPDGTMDESLASTLDAAQLTEEPEVLWPALDIAAWTKMLSRAIENALAADLTQVIQRQEHHLRREFDRINDYFDAYEAELRARSSRSHAPDAQAKLDARLDATRVERKNRCRDQRARHEIRVIPHIDSLLLVAEPAQTCRLTYCLEHTAHEIGGLFIPRARRWLMTNTDHSTQP
jgi:hypothetical protein